ncbi:MAG: DNA-binding protein WhiA [Candidatus Limnocylindrales bacterium]
MERDLVAALWAELAAIEPARRCCRVAERAGLGVEARGRARTPVIGRLAVRLDDGVSVETIDRDNLAAHCRIAYLRGMILAQGSISLTSTGSHLELVVPVADLPVEAFRVASLGFAAGTRTRRGHGVLTWKESDLIIGLLRRLGASASVMEIEMRLLSRTLRGQMNRVVNAEAANLRRAVGAAYRQLEHIQTLERGDGLNRLSKRARQVVDARRKAPEATFAELAVSIGLSRAQVQRAFYELQSVALHQGEP